MMGPKSLDEIRAELRYLLSRDGEDPIKWVEKRMAAGRQDSEVLKSIRALLEAPGLPKKPKEKPSTDQGRKVMEELESLRRSLEREVKSKRKPKSKKPRPAKKR